MSNSTIVHVIPTFNDNAPLVSNLLALTRAHGQFTHVVNTLWDLDATEDER